jgi:exonuclease VII small subunit
MLTIFQEAVEKYQQSKRELDEVVAQMESLVSPTSESI